MIYDTLENLSLYKGIHRNLDYALNFLESIDLNKLPLGITKINGDEVYANVMEGNLKDASELSYEFHKRYADIQLDIIGEEMIGIGFLAEKGSDTYDDENDFGTIRCRKEVAVPLGENRFIICLLKEPHKPGIYSTNSNFVKKCVIKVLMED